MKDIAAQRPTKNEELRTKNSRFAAPNFNLNSKLKLSKNPALKTAGFFYYPEDSLASASGG